MKLKNIKSSLKKIDFEEKVIGASALIILISCFLPWYVGPELRVTEIRYLNYNAFESFAYIIGYLVCALSLVVLTIVASRVLRIKLPKLKITYDDLRMYVGGEMIIFTAIAFFIYSNQAQEFSQASTGMGLYLSMFGSISISCFSYLLQVRKKEIASRRSKQRAFESSYKGVVKPQPENIEQVQQVVEPIKRPDDAYGSSSSTNRNIVNEALKEVGKTRSSQGVKSDIMQRYYQNKRQQTYNQNQDDQSQIDQEVVTHLDNDHIERQ